MLFHSLISITVTASLFLVLALEYSLSLKLLIQESYHTDQGKGELVSTLLSAPAPHSSSIKVGKSVLSATSRLVPHNPSYHYLDFNKFLEPELTASAITKCSLPTGPEIEKSVGSVSAANACVFQDLSVEHSISSIWGNLEAEVLDFESPDAWVTDYLIFVSGQIQIEAIVLNSTRTILIAGGDLRIDNFNIQQAGALILLSLTGEISVPNGAYQLPNLVLSSPTQQLGVVPPEVLPLRPPHFGGITFSGKTQ